MNKTCFIDSACFIALLNKSDSLHEKTQSILSQKISKKSSFITSVPVLFETADAFSSPATRNSIPTFFSYLKESSNTRIIPMNHDLWNKSVEIFTKHSDKKWSFTDCSSMAIMIDEEISEIITPDHHFKQAGFIALLND